MTKKFPPLPNLDTVDIKLLRVFAAVVKNRGFSAAQMELNVNQPTISANMSQLEVRLGMKLCHRGRSGFRLTEQGEKVYEAIQSLFNAIEIFKTDVGSFRGQLVGEIHIGMVDALVTNDHFRLGEIIKAYNDQAPEVKINLHKKSPHALQRNIMEEKLHFAIAPQYKMSESVSDFFLFDEIQTLYCSNKHPRFAQDLDALPIEDLQQEAFVARDYQPFDASRQFISRNVISQSGDMECLATLILSGNCIGYLPKPYAKQWVDNGQMKAIKAQEFSYRTRFTISFKQSKLNLATKLFLSMVKDAYVM